MEQELRPLLKAVDLRYYYYYYFPALEVSYIQKIFRFVPQQVLDLEVNIRTPTEIIK
jgi:hypothetical protein